MAYGETLHTNNAQRPLLRLPPLGDLECYDSLLNRDYLQRIYSVLRNAIERHPSTLAFRVDLRLPRLWTYDCLDRDVPSAFGRVDAKAISRFFPSFQAQLDADLKRKRRLGRRVHACDVRYVWCRERCSSEQPHYHLLILVNNQTYRGLGSYGCLKTLAGKVIKAWASALGGEADDARRLVHFPRNCEYRLNHASPSFDDDFQALFYRASYLAKLDTKEYGTRSRAFGSSHR